MRNATALVLCGGQSSRMGRPKALLPWKGRTLLAHTVDVLRAVVDEVIIVSGGFFDLPATGARVVIDPEPHMGPLAGIRNGLVSASHDRVFVTATDAPFLDQRVVLSLLDHQRDKRCAVLSAAGRLQPLVAVYPKAAADAAEILLREGVRRPLALLETMGFDTLSVSAELCERMRGLNTPDDYLSAVRSVEPDSRVRVEFLGSARRALGEESFDAEIGTLAEVLAPAARALELFDGELVSRHYLVSIDAQRFTRSALTPVGPDERVYVMDAAVGG